MLAGCKDKDADDNVAPVAVTTPAPAEAMPANPMPADAMPATETPADGMHNDGNMSSHDMAAMGSEMSFADMDKNHDGSVTADELMDTDMLHQHFAVADSNGDGKLSEAEIMKHRADMAAAPAK
ncbi:MAG: EF-hand domain-containing protein [Thermomonas sp.]